MFHRIIPTSFYCIKQFFNREIKKICHLERICLTSLIAILHAIIIVWNKYIKSVLKHLEIN